MFGAGMPPPIAGGAPMGMIPNSPSVPPASINTPGMPSFGSNPLTDIFKALFSPEEAALAMAQNGVSPEDFAKSVKPGNLSSVMQQQAQSGKGAPVSGLFGDKPLIDRGGYDLPKLGSGGEGAPVKQPDLAQLMQPALPPMQQEGAAPTLIPAPTPPVIPPIAPPVSAPPLGLPPLPAGGGVAPAAAPMVAPPISPPVVPPPASVATPLPPVSPEITPSGQGALAANGNANVMGGAGGSAPEMGGNDIYTEFMTTIRTKVTNPNGLAAIASTGKSESGFNSKNAYGSWSDPSQSGEAGTSGGIMSWRGPRLQAMRNFVKANGGDVNAPSAKLQAEFLLQEDPQLIDALNAAKTPEEAQTLMNNAWQFAGYNSPGTGEAARRISLARNFAGEFARGGLPNLGIAGDPSGAPNMEAQGGASMAGMPSGGTGVGAGEQKSLAERMAEALKVPEGGGGDNSIPPPGAVPPRPGEYSPDANLLKLIMMMLMPGGGATAIPSISQFMSGQTGQGRGA